MVENISSKILTEVQNYLKPGNTRLYAQFQQDLESELKNLCGDFDWINVIYKVYSRADKQYGSAFKEDWKIAKKLQEWRNKNSSTSVQDVHDIIGLTIVMVYPSSLKLLADHLSKDKVLTGFKVIQTRKKQEKGYNAYHLVIGGTDPKYAHILCEIQIKTLLHDGWGAKTHDLTYKPSSTVDIKHQNHMNLLGEVLRLVDDQSEILKECITEKWNTDKSRKQTAGIRLLEQLSSMNLDPSHTLCCTKISALLKKLELDGKFLPTFKIGDPLFNEVFNDVPTLIDEHGFNDAICYFSVLLAVLRQGDDLNPYVISQIENWVRTAKTNEEKIRALGSRMIANQMFGEFKSAIEDGEEALIFCTTENLPGDYTTPIKSNLSFTIADANSVDPSSVGKHQVKRAIKLMEEIIQLLPDHPAIKDTYGFVLISCSKDESGIRRGLQYCREAFDIAKDEPSTKKIAGAYFHLHERHAFRRLLEFD